MQEPGSEDSGISSSELSGLFVGLEAAFIELVNILEVQGVPVRKQMLDNLRARIADERFAESTRMISRHLAVGLEWGEKQLDAYQSEEGSNDKHQ